MKAKTIDGVTVPSRRSRAKPGTMREETGIAADYDRSVGGVLRRCAEARAMPEPLEPQMLPPLQLRRARSRSPEKCAKYIQREMSRALPEIWAMLLSETTEHKNLAALKLLLHLVVLYGGAPTRAAATRASRTANAGFARRMLGEFRQRSAKAEAAATATAAGQAALPSEI
ncbi:hypothetical protein [Terriglobus roseus]|uniref:Uncharacterized protein n=1 Tax=Terriglobus roseus TaxID=392734 RepID=A0A1H4MZN3_9BACT|nr:hypothetical protein [Terriglobus roseus]SEB87822.1 hypothetical protein SAMN05443244_2074 [Terriglobus roseus]